MQGDGLAEDGAIGVETPLPEAVTQHGWDGARDVLAIVRGERPAVESGDSKHLEKLRCGQVHADLLGRQGLIHCYKHLVFAENARQSGGMFGERTIVGVDEIAAAAELRGSLHHADQFFRMARAHSLLQTSRIRRKRPPEWWNVRRI